MDNPPDHKSIVAKSNDLIGQMAKFELSELRLIAYCLAHYDSRKPDNRSFTARVSDLTELFPMDKKCAYAVVRQTVMALGKKPLEFREGTKRHYWNWFSGFTYDESNGEFEFKITPEIQPYLLQLEGNFTRYRLGDVYQFKAASTWKLYELLKQWLVKGEWDISLDELRLLLNIAGKYPRWNSLKQRIIDPACKEINETSDIKVDYLKIRRGRKIDRLEFTVDYKKPEEENVIELEPEQRELYKMLIGAGLNSKTAKRMISEAIELNKVSRLLKKVPQMIEGAVKKNINAAKYVTGAVNDELHQGQLFEEDESQEPEYRVSVDCWMAKMRAGEKCEVRQRVADGGSAGQRKKCQICVEKLPFDQFKI